MLQVEDISTYMYLSINKSGQGYSISVCLLQVSSESIDDLGENVDPAYTMYNTSTMLSIFGR